MLLSRRCVSLPQHPACASYRVGVERRISLPIERRRWCGIVLTHASGESPGLPINMSVGEQGSGARWGSSDGTAGFNGVVKLIIF